jgi:hypothetical protein
MRAMIEFKQGVEFAGDFNHKDHKEHKEGRAHPNPLRAFV